MIPNRDTEKKKHQRDATTNNYRNSTSNNNVRDNSYANSNNNNPNNNINNVISLSNEAELLICLVEQGIIPLLEVICHGYSTQIFSPNLISSTPSTSFSSIPISQNKHDESKIHRQTPTTSSVSTLTPAPTATSVLFPEQHVRELADIVIQSLVNHLEEENCDYFMEVNNTAIPPSPQEINLKTAVVNRNVSKVSHRLMSALQHTGSVNLKVNILTSLFHFSARSSQLGRWEVHFYRHGLFSFTSYFCVWT